MRWSLSRDMFIWMRLQNLKPMALDCINFGPDFWESAPCELSPRVITLM
jgi:hypothetical protein